MTEYVFAVEKTRLFLSSPRYEYSICITYRRRSSGHGQKWHFRSNPNRMCFSLFLNASAILIQHQEEKFKFQSYITPKTMTRVPILLKWRSEVTPKFCSLRGLLVRELMSRTKCQTFLFNALLIGDVNLSAPTITTLNDKTALLEDKVAAKWLGVRATYTSS